MEMFLRLLFFLLFKGFLFAEAIVFVHIGPEVPSYVETALLQAHLFNEETPIFLVASQTAKKPFDIPPFVTFVAYESLKKSKEHENFLAHSTLDASFRQGFWLYATERFFSLYDCIKEYALEDVVHLENDVMLFCNIKMLLPVLKKFVPKIGATFDNPDRCIPGFVYIAKAEALQPLIAFLAEKAKKGKTDMETLARYRKKQKGNLITPLPIVMQEYANIYFPQKKDLFSNHEEDLQSIFDAAAIGQYLGGIDPRNGTSTPGFINESCVFDPSKLQFTWEIDDQGRKVPFASFQGKKCRINNLHIHSKNLQKFYSKASQ